MALLKKYAIFGLVFVWTVVIFAIYFVKHNYQFQTFGLDTGFFSQIIYKASLGDFSPSTISRWSFFTDHFQPILLLFVPPYWIKPSIYWLFGGEALIFSASVVPLFFLSLKLTKSYLFSYALAFAYLILVPTQHGIFDGFSQAVFVSLFLALVYYALTTKKNLTLLFSLIGLLLVKEEFSLLVSGLGIIIFLAYDRKKLGILVSLAGFLFFLFLVRILNPLISPGDLNYAHQNVGYGPAGSGIISVIIFLFTHPWSIVTSFFDSPVKVQTMVSHLFSFAFLPLLSPTQLILLVQQYLLRFLNYEEPIKWQAHDFAFGPILFTASVYGFKKLSAKLKIFAPVIIIIAALLSDLIYHGPVNSLLKPSFYSRPAWALDNSDLMAMIPDNTSVAASNPLVPHLSIRKQIFLLPNINNAEYVIVDLHDPYGNYADTTHTQLVDLIGKLISSGQYQMLEKRGQAFLLKKI